jgi:hypothetical protein
MGSNINYSITKAVVNRSGGSAPLSGTYYIVGGVETVVDQVLAAGTNQAVAASFGPPGTASGNLQAIEVYSNQNCTLTTNGPGSADVQTVSISGSPTGGTFALAFNGQITAPIAYNAAASAVQSALQALSNIGGGNLTCTGGPLPGTPGACTFAGSLATGLKSPMTQNSGGLTGGSSPTASVAHTTPGLPQDTINLIAGVPVTWDSQSIYACPFAGSVSGWYVTSATALRLQARILTN